MKVHRNYIAKGGGSIFDFDCGRCGGGGVGVWGFGVCAEIEKCNLTWMSKKLYFSMSLCVGGVEGTVVLPRLIDQYGPISSGKTSDSAYFFWLKTYREN